MKKVGIVAGNGNLPLIAAQAAKKEGFKVYVCAVKGEAKEEITNIADEIIWVKMGELKKLSRFFLHHQVSEICFEGKITKTSIFKGEIRPDLDMVLLFAKLKDRRDDTILSAICNYLDEKGLNVIDSTVFLRNILLGESLYSKRKVSKKEMQDIEFGWKLAKACGGLDIGQSVVVKDKAVLAVEAIEGTDEAIKRGGELGGKGIIVVKVAKPLQDMRFDVPAIGPGTIESIASVKGSVLAFEAGKTIFISKEETIKLADKHNISIIGIKLGDKTFRKGFVH